MPHLYSVHVPKELLHWKDLVAVIIWKKRFAGFFILHLLCLLLAVDFVQSAAAQIQPGPKIVLFAVASAQLR